MELRQSRFDVAIARVRWWRVGLVAFGLVACAVLLRVPHVPWDVYAREPLPVVAGSSFSGRYAVKGTDTYDVWLMIPRTYHAPVTEPFWRGDAPAVRVSVNDCELRPVRGDGSELGPEAGAVLLGRYHPTPYRWFEVRAQVWRSVPEYEAAKTELWIEPEYHGLTLRGDGDRWLDAPVGAIVGILVLVCTLLWLGRESAVQEESRSDAS